MYLPHHELESVMIITVVTLPHISNRARCRSAADSLAAQQAAALYTLKTIIDPSNVLADWTLPASNACGFTGVTCNANSEVMSL